MSASERPGVADVTGSATRAIGRVLLWSERLRATAHPVVTWGAAVVLAGAVALVLLPLRDRIDPVNILLLYVGVSVVTALTLGSGPSALASVVGFGLVNLIFLEPYGTLAVSARYYILALVVYLGVSLTTGQLVARLAQRTETALAEQRRTRLLYELNSALIGDVTLAAILDTITRQVVQVYGSSRARILLPVVDEAGPGGATDDDPLTLEVRATAPADAGSARVDRANAAMATWAMTSRQPAGRRTTGRQLRTPHGAGRSGGWVTAGGAATDVLFVPIVAGDRAIGVLEVTGRPGGGRFGPDDERLLATFAGQAALALERARLTEEAARAEVLSRSDELKSALLAAVSHDLRTPLAAIKASATALLDDQVAWGDADRRDFLHAIDEETDRLTLMVGNLLDLSRIEGGALRPDREWYDIDELVGDVVRRLRTRAGAAGREIVVDVPDDLPPVWFDYVEIAQVLLNLGENALKYTPAGTPIRISARREGDMVAIAVADRGPGIPPATRARLFERFYRGDAEASTISGVGIGLAICRGLVEAHGGTIGVESEPGHGATFRFTLPIGPREASAASDPAPTGVPAVTR
jgi:two-component system, OmpR family, sensor histidine kinase KdpD